jgi:hypothetical protein
MVHLSNGMTIGAMIFYSLLTFFIGPILTRPFLNHHPDQCLGGYLVGFTISILLWMNYRDSMVDKKDRIFM